MLCTLPGTIYLFWVGLHQETKFVHWISHIPPLENQHPWTCLLNRKNNFISFSNIISSF